jgi:D-alanyl-D-alanine carboxypeptidase
MIPLRSCSAAGFSWFAACVLVSSLVLPFAADAQSNKLRTPTRTHAKPIHKQVHQPAWIPNPAVGGRDSHLVVDAVSGRELVEDQAEALRHPASLAKLMTLYMAFAALDSGKLNLGDALHVSAAAVNTQPTKMGVPHGGTVSARDAMMGLITRSANDAAVVLAEAMAGDEATFARQMTQKARQLGMSSTVFRNASGLPDREQVTSARDMARLAHALLRDFPHYYPIFSVQTYFYRGRGMENHNRMLASYGGADGFKTGYTQASGYNLVLSATRDGRRLIGVVMGGGTAFGRDRLMAELMDLGFASAQQQNLAGWQPAASPVAARYNANHFAHNAAIPEQPVRVAAATIVKTMQPAPVPPAAVAAPAPAPAAPPPLVPIQPVATITATPEAQTPSIGSWVIQVGSFGDSNAAIKALERASAALPDLRSKTAVAIDEVQLVQKTFHRARLTNLSQEEAMEGCKKLEQRKIYCSALQVTAWNTPNAR